MRRAIVTACAMVVVTATAASATTVFRDDDGTNETSVDVDYWDDMAEKWFVLPSGSLSNAVSATLTVYGQADSCGLTGNSHQLALNGSAVLDFNPCDEVAGWFMSWAEFPVPLSLLDHGERLRPPRRLADHGVVHGQRGRRLVRHCHDHTGARRAVGVDGERGAVLQRQPHLLHVVGRGSAAVRPLRRERPRDGQRRQRRDTRPDDHRDRRLSQGRGCQRPGSSNSEPDRCTALRVAFRVFSAHGPQPGCVWNGVVVPTG